MLSILASGTSKSAPTKNTSFSRAYRPIEALNCCYLTENKTKLFWQQKQLIFCDGFAESKTAL